MPHSPSNPPSNDSLDAALSIPENELPLPPAPPALLTKPPSQRREALADALIALSLANLCFIQAWFTLLFDEDFGYFNKLPITRAALAGFLLNLLGASLVFWLLMRALRRVRCRWLRLGANLAFCALSLIPLDFARFNFLLVTGGQIRDFLKHPLAIPLLLLCLAAWVHWHRPVTRAFRIVLLIFFPLVAFSVGHAAWLLAFPRVYAEPPARPRPLTPPSVAASATRVIWMIFDELDERMVFTQRPASVRLPELDRLRANALHAVNAFPPGNTTKTSVPALTTGRPVSFAAPVSHNELALTLPNRRGTVGWSTLPNVFSSARQLGLQTALVGWYHPYARVFAPDLDYCFWVPFPLFEQARDYTLAASMTHQLWAVLEPLQHRRLLTRAYHSTLAHSLEAVTNAHYHLVFLHLPEPHLPGIYNAAKNRFTLLAFSRARSYLNNLALADRALGEMRRAMEQAATWDSSWVMVSSDHWWRDSRCFDGKEDRRIPFLVKAPGLNPPQTFSAPMNTLVTHDLVLAILRGQLTNARQVPPWLTEHRIAPPAEYNSAALGE